MPINPVLVVIAIAVLFGLSAAGDAAKFNRGCAALGAAILILMFMFAVAIAASHGKIFYNPFAY